MPTSASPEVLVRRVLNPIVVCVLSLAAVAYVSSATQTPRPASGRVLLVSLDGLATGALDDGQVAGELTRLRALAARGVQAQGLQPHTPSTTANTHAALWTGAWGDSNGITGNTMPLPERAAHSAFERTIGFRADHLRAEPIWVTAARHGIRTVVQQASQSYPFTPAAVGTSPSSAPVVLNGYQAGIIAAPRVIRPQDVSRVPCESGAVPPALACIEWTAGPLTFRGRFESDTPGGAMTRVQIGTAGSQHSVEALAAPVERELPRGRPLARHFSSGLLVDGAAAPSPVMAYFRLFEVSPDGLDFVLYQTAIHELALYDGASDTRADVLRLLREAGGFVGNAAGNEWERERSALGPQLSRGGDGTSERRYLETLEIAVRQSMAHSGWLWRRFTPHLFVVYTSLPDEMDHRFLALARTDPRYADFRRWGFQLVDLTAGALMDLVGETDHLVVVSDHGLAPVTHDVNIGVALHAAGLMAFDDQGRLDPARTKVSPLRNCLLVNTTDWKGGIVPPAERARVLSRAEDALRRIVDPETGARVVTDFVSSAADREALGFGGSNGMDACFGLAQGHATGSVTMRGPEVSRRLLPKGDHNFLGTRPEMQGMLAAAGPRLPRGARWPALRAIDVAPFVSDLLGIGPPAQARGKSPLATQD